MCDETPDIEDEDVDDEDIEDEDGDVDDECKLEAFDNIVEFYKQYRSNGITIFQLQTQVFEVLDEFI